MAAWVLNLDADLELATTGPYTTTNRVRSAMRPHAERLRATLLHPGDVVVTSPDARASQMPGRAFCPTETAVRLLRQVGAVPERHPPMSVLRAVNSRAFSAALGPTLPGEVFVTSYDEALKALSGAPPLGDAWRVKHAHGMAGRNQRTVSFAHLDDSAVAFLKSGIARGGVQIEPNVLVLDEYGMHGRLRDDGTFDAGAVVRQRCDAKGAWMASERLDPADPRFATVSGALSRQVAFVARALALAGYYGPFGVDAFSYRGAHGRAALRVRSEINARYSMGWGVGLGAAP